MTSLAPIWLACLLAAAESGAGAAPAPSGIRFRDVTAQTGIAFRHTDGSSGRRYIVEYVSAGLATFDYDGDGLTDIYFVNGAPLPGTVSETVPGNALYRNLGEFRFLDVTDAAGVGDIRFGLGATVADYDNDGFPDLYVSNFGPNVLYRNNGDGTFSDVTNQAGVGRGDKVGAGVAFLDANGDGCLDLFVSNYVVFSFDRAVTRRLKGVPSYASPLDYTPDRNDFFRNQGDGTFRDAGRESGIAAHAGTGMGMVCADVNGLRRGRFAPRQHGSRRGRFRQRRASGFRGHVLSARVHDVISEPGWRGVRRRDATDRRGRRQLRHRQMGLQSGGL